MGGTAAPPAKAPGPTGRPAGAPCKGGTGEGAPWAGVRAAGRLTGPFGKADWADAPAAASPAMAFAASLAASGRAHGVAAWPGCTEAWLRLPASRQEHHRGRRCSRRHLLSHPPLRLRRHRPPYRRQQHPLHLQRLSLRSHLPPEPKRRRQHHDRPYPDRQISDRQRRHAKRRPAPACRCGQRPRWHRNRRLQSWPRPLLLQDQRRQDQKRRQSRRRWLGLQR